MKIYSVNYSEYSNSVFLNGYEDVPNRIIYNKISDLRKSPEEAFKDTLKQLKKEYNRILSRMNQVNKLRAEYKEK